MSSSLFTPARGPAFRALGLLVLLASLSACAISDTLAEKSQIDYKSAGKARTKPLDVPPDLASPRSNDRYAIPAAGPEDKTYSGYSRDQQRARTDSAAAAVVATDGAGGSAPAVKGMRIERDGQQRWLFAEATPEKLWPVIREFWQESGFIIDTESPDAGVMETDWAENRAKLPQGLIRRTVGRVFESMYSTGERDKFRTRLEKVAGGTEVYVTHRGMVEVYQDKVEKDSTTWQPRPSDPELEVEFLRRLMIRLGAATEQADSAASSVRHKPTIDAVATVGKAADGVARLTLAEGFERAWRRVGLALDRGGFAVDDRDRSKGIYFVRYVDPDSDARREKPGMFSRIFGSSRKQSDQTEVFQVHVESQGEQSVIDVLTKDGKPVPETDRATASRMLALIQEQLKP